MRRFNSYRDAEKWLINEIIESPDFITKTTQEIWGVGFVLLDPYKNKNDHSDYEYAEMFFQWLITGDTDLSSELLQKNPWTARFVDKTGLPESFSSTYGKKIFEQLPAIIEELERPESRRGYINVLIPEDKVILGVKTTHEFPCTIGLQFFVRNSKLHLIVNMRSNNVYKVMPYDIYNFTRLQMHLASWLKITPGLYYHQINSAHLYKGDIRRLKDETPAP